MPNTLDSIKYVKYNKAHLKAGKRNGNKSMLLEYFKEHEGKVRGMKGFVVLDNIQDSRNRSFLPFGKIKKTWTHFIIHIAKSYQI
jgi:hypothetical protein